MSDYNQGLLIAFGSLLLLGLAAFVYSLYDDRRQRRQQGAGRRER